jgi:hypothetical protein
VSHHRGFGSLIVLPLSSRMLIEYAVPLLPQALGGAAAEPKMPPTM